MIQNSDAHFLGDIGKGFSFFVLEKPTFEEVKLAMSKRDHRNVILQK
jgi:PHP family Zn ribbon phosphoesterase